MRTSEKGSKNEVIPRHISALDGLRAFAILAVIFHHCGEYYLLQNSPAVSLLRDVVENLGSGVDLFFALSGFLITGILLDSLRRPYFFKRFTGAGACVSGLFIMCFCLQSTCSTGERFKESASHHLRFTTETFSAQTTIPTFIWASFGACVSKSSFIWRGRWSYTPCRSVCECP